MSWYNSVVLSFSFGEFEGDEPPRDFGPLRKINSWLKRQKFDHLSDLSEGRLGSNAVLFGGCFNYLDVDAFCECVQRQKWACIDDVQVLFWGDNDSKFWVIEFPLPQAATDKSVKKRPAVKAKKGLELGSGSRKFGVETRGRTEAVLDPNGKRVISFTGPNGLDRATDFAVACNIGLWFGLASRRKV